MDTFIGLQKALWRVIANGTERVAQTAADVIATSLIL
jgi:hypothetical protein